MRTKYNERYVNVKGSARRSHVFLKYYNYIETLLTPNIDSYREYTFEQLYVKHSLGDFLNCYKNKRQVDSLVYLTGLTGSGKTSLLKSVFGHYENTYVINDKTLVIPFACDNMVGDKICYV